MSAPNDLAISYFILCLPSLSQCTVYGCHSARNTVVPETFALVGSLPDLIPSLHILRLTSEYGNALISLKLWLQFFWINMQKWNGWILVVLFLLFWGMSIFFSIAAAHFAFPPTVCKHFIFSTSTLTLATFFKIYILVILTGMKWHLTIVLICIPWWLVTLNNFLMYLLTTCSTIHNSQVWKQLNVHR